LVKGVIDYTLGTSLPASASEAFFCEYNTISEIEIIQIQADL